MGSLIEEWLAVGHLSMQVYPATENVNKLTDKFREQGFGVTSVCGCGRSGERTILFVLLDRKYLPIALKILDEVQPGIFYNVADSRAVRGGIFPAPKSRLIKTK
ncbi:hypothetical protein N752_19825 [Desulforamulus aquiferis]|nr:DUF2179 domain-containing protein [Desulforamulus aquiferis]RYD03430.1 hypothetical protein N752_19825 [Desulforamulus aquiferis]